MREIALAPFCTFPSRPSNVFARTITIRPSACVVVEVEHLTLMWHDEHQSRCPLHSLADIWDSHNILGKPNVGEVLFVYVSRIDDLGEFLPLKLRQVTVSFRGDPSIQGVGSG